jgi:branched-chain amino acid transport system permease protein
MTLVHDTPRRAAPRRGLVPVGAVAALAALPFALDALGLGFWQVALTRGLIFAIAAMGLQLVLGRGGLVCFGFAAFMGIGGYAVAIAYHHRLEEALLVLPLGVAAAGLFAWVTGAVALRTRGVYFIMITLAFGQMAYYLATSLAIYGGDDGMSLWSRSAVAGLPLLRDDRVFYWVCLGAAALTWAGLTMLGRSPFGRALAAARLNEARAAALGFDVARVQRVAYALAGALGGLSGVLLANHALFVSPAYLSWHRSGELIIMVVLGGFASLTGAGAGAVLVVLLEEALGQVTLHWRILFGAIVLAVALFARDGLAGALARWRGR